MSKKSRLTKEPWFGPKRTIGWGWTPVSWQGWLCSLAAVVLIVGGQTVLHGVIRFVATVVVLALLVGLMFLTGSPPGGPSS